MTKSTKNYAETTEIVVDFDVIGDALRSLRVSGSVLLRESYAPPWAIAIPDARELAGLLGVEQEGVRVVAFHLVEYGHCAITAENGEELHLAAGEMLIAFGGEAHRLGQGEGGEVVPVERLLQGRGYPRSPQIPLARAEASLLCGVFLLRHTEFNPLICALPPMLRAKLSRAGELHNLSGVARLMAEEMDRGAIGGGYVVERLLEVLCAEAVRAHVEAVPTEAVNWFRGIKDPVIGRAIAAIHARPGNAWSVSKLAAEVAMSPSRFAARFSLSLGESPIAYLARWRMSLACRQLSGSQQSIDRVAESVGYESQAAFSRAFKKHVGVPPAAWRAGARI